MKRTITAILFTSLLIHSSGCWKKRPILQDRTKKLEETVQKVARDRQKEDKRNEVICRYTLRDLDAAKEQYALIFGLSGDFEPPMNYIMFYSQLGAMNPRCPAGGSYRLDRLSCSAHGVFQVAKREYDEHDWKVWKQWIDDNMTPDEKDLTLCMRRCPQSVLTPSPYDNVAPLHENGVAGHVMFAKYSASTTTNTVNCTHAAPQSRIGGWQAVNLSLKQWRRLISLWRSKKPPTWAPPAIWCGKPSPAGRRLVHSMADSGKGQPMWWTMQELVTEEDLKKRVALLNECLAEMKLDAVPLNVPDNVDWDEIN